MTQAAGWYDDPQDPSQLRYWDGVVWSNHVSPKISPTVEQSTIGMPYGVIPASERPHSPGSQGAQGAPTAQRGYDSPQQGQGQTGGQWPAYGQGQGALGQQDSGWQSHPATTPDGVPLSGWWLRVGARVLDGMFTFGLSLPFTAWFYYRYIVGVVDWSKEVASQSAAGSAPVVVFPPWDILQYAFAASIIGLLISGAYEVFFLSRSGATPGKKIVGISVRLRDRAGPPTMKAVLLRTGCILVLSVISSLAYLLDVLWPLWDDKKQAIHDKAAATNVVVGPRPRRDA
ncbi:MAG TPA: RDD family protein [Dermatophilaceae bacterium]|nr:RDD family protein [Dermatophilaceae bacterium]